MEKWSASFNTVKWQSQIHCAGYLNASWGFYINAVKYSFEPDLNQRPKDSKWSTTVLRSTNWAIEGDAYELLFPLQFHIPDFSKVVEI